MKGACRGFSLLEMLLVLVVMAGLVALVAEGYASMVQAAAVTTGADMLSDVFTEARASAVAQNTSVEVRIYDLPPEPGAAPVYDAIQLHWVKADGTTPAVNSVLFLSSWVAIDATAAHSTLIGANAQTATPDAGDTRLNGQTRVFHFLPDGSQLVCDRAVGGEVEPRSFSVELGLRESRCDDRKGADLPAVRGMGLTGQMGLMGRLAKIASCRLRRPGQQVARATRGRRRHATVIK